MYICNFHRPRKCRFSRTNIPSRRRAQVNTQRSMIRADRINQRTSPAVHPATRLRYFGTLRTARTEDTGRLSRDRPQPPAAVRARPAVSRARSYSPERETQNTANGLRAPEEARTPSATFGDRECRT
jgi:hypothetical protein